MTRYVVVGAGIVGLATAHRILLDRPDAAVTVLEKEPRVAAHQTGHNSGVIHAGVYYKPGSLKARLCAAGSRSMVDFCDAHGIPHEMCGKLIVATDAAELPRLHALHERAVANGLAGPADRPRTRPREYEPEVRCVEALHVASTGIVDFAAVCRALAGAGGEGRRRDPAGHRGDRRPSRRPVVDTTAATSADVLVNCAGLHADRVARLAGVDPPARIVPVPRRVLRAAPRAPAIWCAGLIYPVPDPQFPFLGVHLTRMIDGSVHAGPNAVLALAREGYSWRTVSPRDVADYAAYPGLWRLARRHLRYGLTEVRRSLSRRRFAASLARLVPAVDPDDIVRDRTPACAPRRSRRTGRLVDDFLIERPRPAGARAQRAVTGRDELAGDRQAHRGPAAGLKSGLPRRPARPYGGPRAESRRVPKRPCGPQLEGDRAYPARGRAVRSRGGGFRPRGVRGRLRDRTGAGAGRSEDAARAGAHDLAGVRRRRGLPAARLRGHRERRSAYGSTSRPRATRARPRRVSCRPRRRACPTFPWRSP